MQVAKVRGFEKRAQYYAAKAYSNQMNSGEEYGNLKEVIFLAIVDFVMFPDKEGYKSEHVILDKVSYENDLKDFSFTFIELPKFKKERVEDLESYEEKWCYFFKHSKNPDNIEKLIGSSDNVISKAYDVLLSHHWSDQELNAYEQVTKANLDAMAREAQVKEEAMAEGREKGIAEGRLEEKVSIAKKMLKYGVPLEEVMKITGLPHGEIDNLK
jgi:predicted transposase/invertase (TIGR01784 family)